MHPTIREAVLAEAKLRAHAQALGLDDDKVVEQAKAFARERPLTFPQAARRIAAQLHPGERP